MSAMLMGDWFTVDKDVYYRKFDLYDMKWSVSEGLDSMVLAGAAFGGPIALIRDRKQYVQVKEQAKPVIHIYNCAGTAISKIVWKSGVLIHMGWSDSESLLCVQESGDVLVYDMFGGYQHSFSMGPEVRDTKVSSAQIFASPNGTGVAVMTASNRMFLLNNFVEPKTRHLPDLPRPSEKATCWTILSGVSNVTGFLVCRDREVYLCQPGENRAHLLHPEMKKPCNAILHIVTSQDGRHVAMFTDAGCLWMGSSDMKTRYCEIDTGFIKHPKQLVWCGNEAVIGHWNDVLVICGKSGNDIKYSYLPFQLIPEMDCVRIVSSYSHELLQKVPTVVQKIFMINSTEPGSYLVEASKQFQKRSHRADEYICIVKDQLAQAVQQCIDAAAYEFDTGIQKMLIRAAQFGKGFVPDHDPEQYVNTYRWLRVLNSIRDPKVAMPLTYQQVLHLKERILLDRLVWRRLHCLAKHIANYLRLKEGQTRVLAHWACYKVTQPHLDNESVAREIANKLQNVPGVSYTDIAMKAADKGRQPLAIKILEYETRAQLQVPLLLKLGERSQALLRATRSGDTDLVYKVLFDLKDKMGDADFQLLIRNFSLAHALYIKYCSNHNREALRKVYFQEDDYQGQALTYIRDAFEPSNSGNVKACLTSARDMYKSGKNELGVSICDDACKLVKDQASFTETFNQNFVGLSIHCTIEELLRRKELRLADKMRSEYKVPDRRYWWMRILILAEKGDWIELDKFSKSKKSPIGYEAFVDVCLKRDNIAEAHKYLPRCRDDIKVKYYVKAGFYDEAAQVAFEQRDPSALQFVRSKCPITQLDTLDKIENFMSQIHARK